MNHDAPPPAGQPRVTGDDMRDVGLPPLQVSTRELFFGFLKVGLSGFGGVLPFARLMLVERKQWLTDRAFIEVLSLSQFLPGPNIVNVAIIVGRRFSGPTGAAAAAIGLMLMPLVIILLLAAVFGRFAQVDAVRGATGGVSAAAAGLMLAIALKMARPLRQSLWQSIIAVVVFAAIGLARLPLLWVLAVVAPIAIAMAWRLRQ
ncbi:MAG: chromate transporter [Betaproteobacteria bacterium]